MKDMDRPRFFSLARVNTLLTLIVVALALYIVFVPFVPAVLYPIRKAHTDTAPYGALGAAPTKKPLPADNRLVIPSALVDEPILEGSSLRVISKGGTWYKELWTKSPKEKGNTIILGHRFTYQQPQGAFYDLDKVQIGDKLAIYWHGEELLYKVTEKREVPPTTTAVEDDSDDRRLTLYTCTPLLTAKYRLVLVARPIGENE